MRNHDLWDPQSGRLWDGGGPSPLVVRRDPYYDLLVANSAEAPPPNLEVPRPELLEIEEFEDFLEKDTRQQRVAVRILLYQRADRYISLWVDENTSVDDVRLRVAATALNTNDKFIVLEATPKLPDDVISVAVFPAWWRVAERSCVSFNHRAAAGAPFLSSGSSSSGKAPSARNTITSIPFREGYR